LFATAVVYTGGRFAAGVVDTSGNLPPAALTRVANLPPVLLIPGANLPLVSTTLAKLMEKFATGVVDTGGAPSLREFSLLMQYSGSGRKLIHEKNRSKKFHDTVPSNICSECGISAWREKSSLWENPRTNQAALVKE
jgi:hypothetical protein